MGIFSKLFGNKKKDKNLSDMLDDAGLELGVSFGDDSEDLNEEDYKHNHCFIFFGLNEQSFQAIEKEVQNFDGPDHLSLLRSMDGVFMTDFCVASAGSEKVKENLKADETDGEGEEKIDNQLAANASKLRTYIDSRFEQYIEHIKENFDNQVSKECIDLLVLEKNFIVENIRYGMERWSNGETYEKEDFIGAMIVFVKSSKAFDRSDSISENQDGMNLPVTTRGGFIRDCIFATEDILKIDYLGEPPYDTFDSLGEFSKEIINGMEAALEGNNPINKYNYDYGTIYGAYSKGSPFGFAYFDQNGALWSLNEVGKAVTLLHEAADDEMEYYVSH
jgi:hypothetical protein